MRKIVVVEFITLDGVMQAPGGSKEDTAEGFKYGGWMAPHFDDVGGKEMDVQMKATAALLLGRKTYDIFAGFWPTHTETWPQVNDIEKFVMSKTLKESKWVNTTIVRDIDELKEIKNSNGGDLQVYGSSNLIQSLMKEDLIDEMWLKIFPITLGTGKKLFGEGTMPTSFKLYNSLVTPSGVIFAYYKRDGEVKTQDF